MGGYSRSGASRSGVSGSGYSRSGVSGSGYSCSGAPSGSGYMESKSGMSGYSGMGQTDNWDPISRTGMGGIPEEEGGCSACCILSIVLVVAAIIGGGLWWWRPWEDDSSSSDAGKNPNKLTPGAGGPGPSTPGTNAPRISTVEGYWEYQDGGTWYRYGPTASENLEAAYKWMPQTVSVTPFPGYSYDCVLKSTTNMEQ